jgi:hypothetical protein
MGNRAALLNTHPSSPGPRFVIPHILVLVAYFLLTILMTWPTILHFTDGIPGDGFDGWQNYWNLWWAKEAVLVLQTQPYLTDYLYPPGGTNLLFHTLNIFNFLWTLPLQLNFGLAVAYNSVVFFSFVFAGYGGYLLCLYALSQMNLPGRNGFHLSAFAGGLVFTMAPFHLAHLLGHMQVFSMVWPPFYVLWLLRTLQPWATPLPHRYAPRDVLLTCLFLILAALVDWYHLLYLLIFTGLVLAWIGVRYFVLRRNPQTVLHPRQLLYPFLIVIAIGLGMALILSPLLGPMVREASARPDLDTGLAQNITLSADLLAFVTPSEMHPLWGNWARTIAQNFTTTTSERLIFAGFLPLALALFIVIKAWHSPIVKFWILVVAVFFILALGPYLHVLGQIVTVGGWQIPMPYLFLYKTVPFLGLTRSLSRYDLMVMLALGVLMAISLAYLIARLISRPSTHASRNRVLAHLIPVLAIILICFEFLAIPYPISRIDTPQFFYDIAHDGDDYVIAQLPMNWDRPAPMLHQTTHGKRLLTAYTSRDHPSDMARRTPVFQQWRYLGPDIIDQPLDMIAPTIFNDYNLRYIVLDYWQMPPGPERDNTEQWVAAALPGASPVYDDSRLKVYQTSAPADLQPYLSLAAGWRDRQTDDNGNLARSVSVAPNQPAQLDLHHPQGLNLTLEITARGETPQTVAVLLNGKVIGQMALIRDFNSYTFDLPPLSGEMVELKFQSDNPAGSMVVSRVGLRVAQ